MEPNATNPTPATPPEHLTEEELALWKRGGCDTLILSKLIAERAAVAALTARVTLLENGIRSALRGRSPAAQLGALLGEAAGAGEKS